MLIISTKYGLLRRDFVFYMLNVFMFALCNVIDKIERKEKRLTYNQIHKIYNLHK